MEYEALLENTFIVHLYIYIFAYGLLVWLVGLNGAKRRATSLIRLFTIILIIYLSYSFSARNFLVGKDTLTYASYFNDIQDFGWQGDGDLVFYGLMYVVGLIGDFRLFLFIVSVLFFSCAYCAFCRLLQNNSSIAFLIFCISPYLFFAGINALRNGLAASLMLLAISYRQNVKWFVVLLFASCLTHFSMIVPAVSLFMFHSKKSLNILFSIWGVLFLLSIGGVTFAGIIDFMLGFSNTSSVGEVDSAYALRDFLVYGLPVVVLVYWYRNYCRDDMVQRILCLYLVGSCMQVIALHSSTMAIRFAYYSGFLLPLVLVYPLTKLLGRYLNVLCIPILLFVFFLKAYKLFPYL